MMSRTDAGHCFLLVCLLLGVCGLWVPPVCADGPLYPVPTSRFGVDLNPQFGLITDYDVASLHINWYSDWSVSAYPLRPGGIEYVQLFAVREGDWYLPYSWADRWTVLRYIMSLNPGALWLIGNEPECPYPPGGGRNTPEQYAAVYHDLYEYIKRQDPTARVAAGNVVVPTPLRLKWLDRVLAYYQTQYGGPMPVDVWTTHLLILQEKEADWGCGIPIGLSETQGRLYTIVDSWSIPIFKQLVVEFRTWLRDRGYRNKPLWITEYGVLMPYAEDADINALMTASFDFMLYTSDPELGCPADSNLLVQRWAWCSLNESPTYFNGALFESWDNTYPGTLTALGHNFKAYTSALAAQSVCINGTVHLEGRPAAPDASYITTVALTLLRVGSPQPDLRNVTTGESGDFRVCDVPIGTYDIVAKGYNTLANRISAVQVTAGTTSVDLGVLRSGDANNDNQNSILDFSILALAYGAVEGEPTYDHRADFNGDGQVNIVDFSLLASRFGEVGASAG